MRSVTSRGNGVDIGLYDETDAAAILDCLAEGFGFEPDPHSWHRLFFENPAGDPIILIARSGDQVVSHYGILPRRVLAFGEAGLAAHVVDVTTRPGWQRQGVRTMLGMEAMRQIAEGGFLVGYAFNNDQSYPGSVKYERATALHQPPVMIKPLRPFSAGLSYLGERLSLGRGEGAHNAPEAAIAGPLPIDASLAHAAIASGGEWKRPSFDREHTWLFEQVDGLPRIAVIRDQAHMTWRYPGCAETPYLHRDVKEGDRVVATAVVRTTSLFGVSMLLLMDWMWAEGRRNEGRDLLDDAVEQARRAGACAVAAMAMPGTLHHRLLRNAGFISVPHMMLPKAIHFVVRLDRPVDDPTPWMEPSSWYLTWGDGFLL